MGNDLTSNLPRNPQRRGGGQAPTGPGGRDVQFEPAAAQGRPIFRYPEAIMAHTSGTRSIAATTTDAAQIVGILNEFQWDRTVIGRADATAPDLSLFSLLHRNDPLTSGEVPVDLFAQDSLHTPRMGRFVDVSDPFTYQVRNYNAGALVVQFAFTASMTPRPRNRNLRPRWDSEGVFIAGAGPGRSLVCFGPAGGAQNIAAAATGSFSLSPAEPTFMDKLILNRVTNLSQVTVTGVLVNNKPVVPGNGGPGSLFAPDSWANPCFSHYVTNRDTVIVNVTNNSAATVRLLPAFTTL